MKVKRFQENKERPIITYTNTNLMNELNYYLADNYIQELFLFDEITLEEYRKIRRENIKKFKPILAELLL